MSEPSFLPKYSRNRNPVSRTGMSITQRRGTDETSTLDVGGAWVSPRLQCDKCYVLQKNGSDDAQNGRTPWARSQLSLSILAMLWHYGSRVQKSTPRADHGIVLYDRDGAVACPGSPVCIVASECVASIEVVSAALQAGSCGDLPKFLPGHEPCW
ncbi:hypothetical protein TGPRC2_212775 [Toxoplasma gondii TgCatPRC2]|uniref:Uncharacterized protein n=8 Tax=Toxoplasma gondii TaxID=5811 RepID=V4Z5Q9_TOXGV|nr:hypothetical protein TGVEG_212775 [Toxoplasma gondii VEG]KFG40427.1 hypothetical protein TGDOM2_212775 [Toxoplasma gondii GAB2-2007-GAL-DOM2]KFG44131.1 hypothetical protein TGP89_212775 [Toxoplasma gondii p89]KFG63063.1 hypothetical protein TGRUB_212775 [Toxoplasma gondii RUB]KFH08687.1 hypothetical protein TGVAND_212775 [Toxoplasma gondii VAND]KFH10384.1 hypothetical protein TGMAS_212775 [Toxoplasma gondii MAS]KYK68717.1 hypothetical protein TGPRC2_212775 [Toxoplasma gondii TgCatPRC2]PIM